MSNFPPGVTGNEPEITGEWPCRVCSGARYDEDEDGKHACPYCKGTGIDPEEPPYCLNCDNENYTNLYEHKRTGIIVCNTCRDVDFDATQWEVW